VPVGVVPRCLESGINRVRPGCVDTGTLCIFNDCVSCSPSSGNDRCLFLQDTIAGGNRNVSSEKRTWKTHVPLEEIV
jgi:hypothetical protein